MVIDLSSTFFTYSPYVSPSAFISKKRRPPWVSSAKPLCDTLWCEADKIIAYTERYGVRQKLLYPVKKSIKLPGHDESERKIYIKPNCFFSLHFRLHIMCMKLMQILTHHMEDDATIWPSNFFTSSNLALESERTEPSPGSSEDPRSIGVLDRLIASSS